jgi:proteasome accessory factor C
MPRKFSAPLERTARLLDLVPYISSHQGISLKQLAKDFDVSQSQMTDDLTTLWMCGLPGYTPLELMDLDFESGYVTIHNAETLAKPRAITFDEGVALLLGLDLLRSSLTADRSDLLASIDLLSVRLSTLIKLPAALAATSVVNQDVSAAITEAMRTRTGLEISYHSLYRDEVSSRIINPLEIIEVDGQRYLSSYCHTAGDFRQFRIDRIKSAKAHGVVDQVPQNVNQGSSYTCTIKVLAPNRDIAERFKRTDLAVNTYFEFESFSQQWIERSVLASGNAVALQSPLEIRHSIAVMAQSMLDRYKAR